MQEAVKNFVGSKDDSGHRGHPQAGQRRQGPAEGQRVRGHRDEGDNQIQPLANCGAGRAIGASYRGHLGNWLFLV